MDEDNIIIDILDDDIKRFNPDDMDIANGIWEHTKTSLFNGIKTVPFKAVVAYVCKQYLCNESRDITVVIQNHRFNIENAIVIPMSASEKFRMKLSKAVTKRIGELFGKDAFQHLDNDRIASEEAEGDEQRYRIIKQYEQHFRGKDAIKARRFIRSIPEARVIRDFIIINSKYPEQWEFIKQELQRQNKNATREGKQPIKWTDVKAKLISELQVNLMNCTSPFKDTARFNKIATYTVNNIILAVQPFKEEESFPYQYDDSILPTPQRIRGNGFHRGRVNTMRSILFPNIPHLPY